MSGNPIQPTYFLGVKHSVPTALGYLVVSFTFGMIACTGGLSVGESTLISMTSLTSAGQFAGLNILFAGGTCFELILSMILVNCRYMLMSTALSQKIEPRLPLWKKMVMSAFITDENFSVAMVEVETIPFRYYMGVVTLPYLGWSVGTLLGAEMDALLSAPMQNAASIALYCMFIALFIPPAKEQKPIREVVIVTIALSLLFYYCPLFALISAGYKILLAAIIGAVFGAIRHPQEVV